MPNSNVRIQIHQRNVEARIKSSKDWDISSEDKKDFTKFLNDLGLGKVNRGFKISRARQLKYLDLLRTPLEFWGKPTSKLTLKDVEEFEKAISNDKIKSKAGRAYSHETKRDIKLALRIYLKWKLGEPKALQLAGWLDTRRKAKTPDYLKESEVEKLYKACKSAGERFLVSVLFDSGARAEEFLNIRYEDIELPKEGEEFVKITLKEEYSKTKGRTIRLYWKYSLESVRDFLQEREKEGIESNEAMYIKSYDNTRKFLQRLGKKILNKSVSPHLFRHSSATYYANKMNRQELCYRYGWAFSSHMPDTYISRAGMTNKELDIKFKATEINKVQTELEKQKQENKIMKDQMMRQLDELRGLIAEKGLKQVAK